MAMFVKIDFDNTYKIEDVSPDLKINYFNTVLKNGDHVPLKVEISNKAHELLPNVYNLAFGPLNYRGEINDKAELSHQNNSKVFSTILLAALNYLSENGNHYLGIDGSDNFRAYYYWRFLQRNYDYLHQHFEMYGLKYYVRISRFGRSQYDNPFDFQDIYFTAERIAKTSDWPKMMYNYFTFKLIAA
jgi:hypothetical protein